ncbi:hypothetical protein BDA96_04G094400 [Sorghum bicolor]|uniref:Uncharacterized protein n=1 Tax=Sorghum bicolor TaxID=4558 RepID=A0A921R2T0_SORBI|nr:hypothetical protein BDA96_04G094400 [Sorghum bicolor]
MSIWKPTTRASRPCGSRVFVGIHLRPADTGRYSPSRLGSSRPRLDFFLRRRPSVLASPRTPPVRPRLSSDAAPPSSRLLRRHRPCGSSTSVSTGLGAADGRIFLPPPVHPLVQLFIRRSLIRPCQFNHCSVTGRPRPKIRYELWVMYDLRRKMQLQCVRSL